MLGKFEHEVAELSPDEIARWLGYLKLQKEAQKRGPGPKRAKALSGSGPKANPRRR